MTVTVQLLEAVGCLVDLAQLMASGHSTSVEAHRLRERIADLQSMLGDEGSELLDDLSSDLYALEDDEIYDPPADVPDLLLAIREAYDEERWADLLVLLRQESPGLEPHVRSRYRGYAYEGLGHAPAARAFREHSARVARERVPA